MLPTRHSPSGRVPHTKSYTHVDPPTPSLLDPHSPSNIQTQEQPTVCPTTRRCSNRVLKRSEHGAITGTGPKSNRWRTNSNRLAMSTRPPEAWDTPATAMMSCPNSSSDRTATTPHTYAIVRSCSPWQEGPREARTVCARSTPQGQGKQGHRCNYSSSETLPLMQTTHQSSWSQQEEPKSTYSHSWSQHRVQSCFRSHYRDPTRTHPHGWIGTTLHVHDGHPSAEETLHPGLLAQQSCLLPSQSTSSHEEPIHFTKLQYLLSLFSGTTPAYWKEVCEGCVGRSKSWWEISMKQREARSPRSCLGSLGTYFRFLALWASALAEDCKCGRETLWGWRMPTPRLPRCRNRGHKMATACSRKLPVSQQSWQSPRRESSWTGS